jgi:hypothetical protein
MRAAMAMEMIVGPARAPADRWTPERFAENTPDNAAGNSPNRARDDEACPRSRRGTYPIGACARRSDRDSAQRTRRQHTRRQNEIAHLPSPWPRQAGCRAKPRNKISRNAKFHTFVANVRRFCGRLRDGYFRHSDPARGKSSDFRAPSGLTWFHISPRSRGDRFPRCC